MHTLKDRKGGFFMSGYGWQQGYQQGYNYGSPSYDNCNNYGYGGGNNGSTFVLIVVLFILLIIVGSALI